MNDFKPIRSTWIECCCGSRNHVLRFAFDPNKDEEDLWLEVHLNPHLSFFKRLWTGIKYIFGFGTCGYGCFDNWALFNDDDDGRLESVISVLTEAKAVFDAKKKNIEVTVSK